MGKYAIRNTWILWEHPPHWWFVIPPGLPLNQSQVANHCCQKPLGAAWGGRKGYESVQKMEGGVIRSIPETWLITPHSIFNVTCIDPRPNKCRKICVSYKTAPLRVWQVDLSLFVSLFYNWGEFCGFLGSNMLTAGGQINEISQMFVLDMFARWFCCLLSW